MYVMTFREVLRCLAILLVLATGVSVAQTDADSDLIAKGEELYRTAGNVGCAACHGAYALGDLQIGPNIRGVDAVRIQGALEAAEEMAFLLPILSQDDILAVEAFLADLATKTPASSLLRRSDFEPAEVTLPPASRVQLIVQNGNRSACTLQVDGVEGSTVINGREFGAVTWTTGDTSQTVAYCAEDPEARLTVTVAEVDQP